MAEFTRTRKEVEDLFDRWLQANREAEEKRDWSGLAEFYALDAVYQYTMGKAGLRVARGKDEVRRLVMERDMEGFDGWTFPYEWVVIDGDKVMTKWWNQMPVTKEDGSPYRVLGVSCIRINNDLQIQEMHDCFDAEAVFQMVREANRERGAGVRIPGAAEAEPI